MGVEGVPEYSDRALAVRDFFFSGIADIHFFVEDADQENLYDVIFRRVFPKITSFQVFPLAGKGNVIAHATAGHPLAKGTKRVYVLDKDFDDLLGSCIRQSDVFYLDDYSIENSLIDETAVLQFAVDESPKVRAEKLSSAINFAGAIKDWAEDLNRLHRAFFLVQKYSLGMRNCDCPPDIFVSSAYPLTFDSTKVLAYINRVAKELLKAGVISSLDEYQVLSDAAFVTRRFNRRHISGKFLLKLFLRHLRYLSICGNVRVENATIRFARFSELSRLRNFKQRVNAYLAA